MTERSFKWRYVFEFVGAISIVSSLIFVGLELRQAQQATANERTISRVDIGIGTRNAINQFPEIWIKGNKGESLTDAEYVIYSNLIQVRNSEVEATGLTALSLGRDINDNLTIIAFSDFLFRNPGALTTWNKILGDIQPTIALFSGDPNRMSPVRRVILGHLSELGANTEN